MKNYKKLLALFLAATFFTTFTLACSDDDDDDNGTENSTSQTNSQNSSGDNQTSDNQSVELTNVPEQYSKEITAAFDYINKIRSNPASYSDKIGVDLSYVEARAALNWDENLAKAAQEKAEDMANNNYFSHVDQNGYGMNYKINAAGYALEESWYSDISSNYFENICAGKSTGVSMVEMLVLDEGTNPPGHRNSLLGIGDFYKNNVDIGIGLAYNANSTYKYYWSILVARHSW